MEEFKKLVVTPPQLGSITQDPNLISSSPGTDVPDFFWLNTTRSIFAIQMLENSAQQDKVRENLVGLKLLPSLELINAIVSCVMPGFTLEDLRRRLGSIEDQKQKSEEIRSFLLSLIFIDQSQVAKLCNIPPLAVFDITRSIFFGLMADSNLKYFFTTSTQYVFTRLLTRSQFEKLDTKSILFEVRSNIEQFIQKRFQEGFYNYVITKIDDLDPNCNMENGVFSGILQDGFVNTAYNMNLELEDRYPESIRVKMSEEIAYLYAKDAINSLKQVVQWERGDYQPNKHFTPAGLQRIRSVFEGRRVAINTIIFSGSNELIFDEAKKIWPRLEAEFGNVAQSQNTKDGQLWNGVPSVVDRISTLYEKQEFRKKINLVFFQLQEILGQWSSIYNDQGSDLSLEEKLDQFFNPKFKLRNQSVNISPLERLKIIIGDLNQMRNQVFINIIQTIDLGNLIDSKLVKYISEHIPPQLISHWLKSIFVAKSEFELKVCFHQLLQTGNLVMSKANGDLPLGSNKAGTYESVEFSSQKASIHLHPETSVPDFNPWAFQVNGKYISFTYLELGIRHWGSREEHSSSFFRQVAGVLKFGPNAASNIALIAKSLTGNPWEIHHGSNGLSLVPEYIHRALPHHGPVAYDSQLREGFLKLLQESKSPYLTLLLLKVMSSVSD